MADHARRSTPGDAPHLTRFAAMTMDERWLGRTPEEMLDDFHWFRGEGFDLVVEDLAGLTATGDGPPVLAEGFRLLPHLVAPLLAAPHHAVWLLPTPAVRRAALESRGDLWSVAGRTSDPERALAALLERDHLFTERLRAECAALSLPTVDVDPDLSEDALTTHVAATLHL